MKKDRSYLLVNIISAILIFLFAYTAFSKLSDMEPFQVVLRSLPLIGLFSGFAAWSVIFLEWLIVLLLLYAPARLIGFYLSAFLMFAFTGYIAVMLITKSRLPCSCGGIVRSLTWQQHLYFNIFLLIAAVTGLIMERKKQIAVQLMNRR